MRRPRGLLRRHPRHSPRIGGRPGGDTRWLPLSLAIALAASVVVFEPVAQFRVLRRSQGGSLWKLARATPAYLRIWLDRFSRQLARA